MRVRIRRTRPAVMPHGASMETYPCVEKIAVGPRRDKAPPQQRDRSGSGNSEQFKATAPDDDEALGQEQHLYRVLLFEPGW